MAVDAWLIGSSCALDRLHPADHVLQLAGGGLEVLVEVFQPGGGVAVGGKGVVVLGPHPGDVLGQLAELRADLVGVAPGGVERALEAEELLGVIAQRDRGLDLPAQLAHADLDLIELLAALTHALQLALGLAHPRLMLFHPGHLALRRFAPLAQDVDLRRAIQHSAHGAELLEGGLGPGDQRLQGDGDVRAAGIDGDDGVVRFAAAFQEADHVVLRGGGAVNDEMSRADDVGSATDVPIGALAYMRKEGLVEEGRNVVIGWEIKMWMAEGAIRPGGDEAREDGPAQWRPARALAGRGGRAREPGWAWGARGPRPPSATPPPAERSGTTPLRWAGREWRTRGGSRERTPPCPRFPLPAGRRRA